MTIDTQTTLPPDAVLTAAKRFFSERNPLYASFLDKEGPNYVSMRGQGGEEVIIAVEPMAGGTAVRGSTYLFEQQLRRFFSTLDPMPMVTEVGQ